MEGAHFLYSRIGRLTSKHSGYLSQLEAVQSEADIRSHRRMERPILYVVP